MHVCGCVVILWFSISRRIVVDESRVTAAVWGPFDQFLITGHEDGTLAHYNITEVSPCLHLLTLPLPLPLSLPLPSTSIFCSPSLSLPSFPLSPLLPSLSPPSLSLPSFPLSPFLPSLSPPSLSLPSFPLSPLLPSPPSLPSQIYNLISTDPYCEYTSDQHHSIFI